MNSSILRALACTPLIFAAATHAAFDPAREYVETPAVAARFPDPAVDIATPAFRTGREDFTSQDEMITFVESVAARSRDARIVVLGRSQEGRAIPLLVFARPVAGQGADVVRNGKPTVLIIGQQHGNEPAGGEAALALALELGGPKGNAILDRVNVLIAPRTNPDGAHHFVRGLANGADVNRDHLLEATPEGRAIGRVFVEFQPDVVLDCHEFGVKLRWYEKFGALQRYDALIQYATVSNLPASLTDAAERLFRAPMIGALEAVHLTHSWYYTTSYDAKDLVVSMGGVSPDTGRNIAGLRNAVSFLIETRGVGIGRAHFKRRVHTHLVAMHAMLDAAAANAGAVLALGRRLRQEVAAAAGTGTLVVSGAATPSRHTLDLVDPESGADRAVEVDWRSALSIVPRVTRTRPFGYLLPAEEQAAAKRLVDLGATVMQLEGAFESEGERYRITRMQEARKDDVRRNDEDTPPSSIVQIATVTESARIAARRGDFYVPLDQPLANVIAAALEPDTQSSYAANRVLTLPPEDAKSPAYLPLFRLLARMTAATIMWDGR
ncbi:MAG TPA: M14 family metallopeptidase [Casimicrobiaceae bacterium]|nr:M14 family metallopeptidase [Casimicrobiaceae bacterium]